MYFPGISIAGGKADKSCVAILQYYPSFDKIFLTKVFERIQSEERLSADEKIYRMINDLPKEQTPYVAFDAPLSLPRCLSCQLNCPGYEACDEPHIQWMWRHYDRVGAKKKPKRFFTPYTQRPAEMYISEELEENFYLHHSLGSNMAPLAARANFLARRLQYPTVETRPKVSLWRIGESLKVNRSHLRFHRHSVGGDESRLAILNALSAHNLAFLYQQDLAAMVKNSHAFEAFICGFTGFLKYKGQTESPPENFPESENWIEYPKKDIQWS